MTKPKTRRTAAEWAGLAEAWQASGQSQREFSRDHGINNSTLSNWIRKMTNGGVRKKRKRSSRAQDVSTFAEVRTVGTVSDGPSELVEITNRRGLTVRFSGAVNATVIRAVVKELMG